MWLQIVSDVTGLSQLLPAVTIGASYGDALLAGLGTGLLPSPERAISQWVPIDHAIESDPTRHALHGD